MKRRGEIMEEREKEKGSGEDEEKRGQVFQKSPLKTKNAEGGVNEASGERKAVIFEFIAGLRVFRPFANHGRD